MDWLCDRCGDTRFRDTSYRCATYYDPITVRSRYRDAVLRARSRRPTPARPDSRRRPAA